MANWYAIDTAPRDGTAVLLAAEAWEYTHGTVQVGYFEANQWHVADMVVDENDADFDPTVEVEDDDTFIMEGEKNVGPTHWMPLPDAPSSFG